jgi:hypothetical protein
MFFNLAVMPYVDSLWMTNEVVYHYRYGGVTSRYMPILRDGWRYFDARYDYCYEFDCQQCLPAFFRHYLNFFYMEVRMQMHYHVDTEEGIRKYVAKELRERKIVRWAIEHLPMEKRNSPKEEAVLSEDVDGIMTLARQDEKRLWRHYLLKRLLLWYQKMIG